ncbi:MAG TPA: UDP-N-acetylglucosamine diphosphorylase/glucosamine-1-phosphate N-acetyltransferase [Pseudohongiella sp.]|nr:UDP-N-acetylglucosamine diphosphorylase/glucosamine-1-phosphate N-acetyltransferase [Pseudohongiella sp.]HBX38588.1 UDP-N-acetylglucosamine diphosphorylase/glucosamine-1-phosphate N-acetyltransferase [Pseudohongiella sp.]|tara:strand:- start:14086 stop:15462 length:1377 start_codon:yes stop_codon:yes gene_type:complete
MNTDVIVLAAGKGTRMYSDKPKVLHELAGRPMLTHVLHAARQLQARKTCVVTGFQSDLIRNHYSSANDVGNLVWVMQSEQLGTGHAVMQAVPELTDDDAIVLILYGDVPLIQPESLRGLTELAETHGIAVLTLQTENPFGLGRILRNDDGHVVGIVEEKDATDEQRQIKEINTGIMAFRAGLLKKTLTQLNTNNAQGEYYLTDTVAIANAAGVTIAALQTQDEHQVQGVNNRLQLAELERAYQTRKARELALKGVTIMDPGRVDIRGEVTIGRDSMLDINVILQGKVSIGDNVVIGPNVTIIDSSIGNNVHILANSHIEGATLSDSSHVGPFARLRPGTALGTGSKIGNFVETKKATLGTGSKVNHLSYIGDSEIGEHVNVGAGTITCNYDGVNKAKTVIKDGAFIGSNTALVAPVTVGRQATVAAGSVITSDVPDKDLAVARGRQKNISGWQRPVKK